MMSLYFRYAVPPTLLHDKDEYTVVVSSPVQMSCEARGFPPPVITWYQNGVELAENSTWSAESSGHVLANGALRIERVTANDSGVYECRALNDAGTASRVVTLSVHGTSRRSGRRHSSYQGPVHTYIQGDAK